MAELQRERLRLLQERSNYRSNVETTEVHRRQNGNTTMPIIRRTNSNKLASEFNALMNQTTTNEIRPSERHERQRRPVPNLQLDMSVINELQEVSSPRLERGPPKPNKNKIEALKQLVDGLLEEQNAADTERPPKKNHIEETQRLQRYNSEATLLNHGKLHREVREELDDLDRLESKVTNQILALRNDKRRLIKSLNEETQHLNEAMMEIQRLERELKQAKRKDGENQSQEPPKQVQKQNRGMDETDKEAIINTLNGRADLRVGRHNVRERIEPEVTRYQREQEKELKMLQEKVVFLEDMLQKANAYIKEVDHREKVQVPQNNQEQFLEDIARLERQLQSAQAVNEEIRASTNAAYSELQEELMMLKADNEELRAQAVELLQQPERRFTYQQEILRLKAEIEKENEAKMLFTQQITQFKRQYIDLEEENVKLRKRLLQLESTPVRQPK